jgi:hypothetical protein
MPTSPVRHAKARRSHPVRARGVSVATGAVGGGTIALALLVGSSQLHRYLTELSGSR